MMKIFHKIILKFLIRSRLNIKLGRIFFYNDGGLLSNVVGRYVKKRDSRRSEKLGFHSPRSGMVDILDHDGFLISNDVANHEVIERLAFAWDDYVNKQDLPEDGRLQLSSADNSRELVEFMPLLEQLITKDVQETLESYYEGYSRIMNYHIYRTVKPANMGTLDSYGATANWHTDGSTSESIKLFFMLSDVTKNNGPMEILSKRDTEKVIKSKQFYFPDDQGKTEQYVNEFCESISLQGKAGSSFYARTNDILHRASIPNEGEHRDLIVFYITSSSKKRTVNQQLKGAKYREIYGLQRLYIN